MSQKYEFNNEFFSAPIRLGSLELFQIGRMHCDEKTDICTHIQGDLYELTVVTGGRGYVTTNNVTSTVESGDIYLNLPFDTHRIVSDSISPLKFDFIAFNTDDDGLKKDLEIIQETFKNPQWRTFKSEQINHLVNNCIHEFVRNKSYHDEIAACSVKLILMYTCRAFLSQRDDIKKHISEKEKLCFQVMHYIDTHIYSIRSLEEVSDAFNYTYSHLATLFKSTIRSSVSEYYESKKFNLSKQLITIDNMKVFEISELFGYSSPYAFSKAYKNYFGISPKQEQLAYRNKKQENE